MKNSTIQSEILTIKMVLTKGYSPKHKEIMERMKKELKGLIRTLDDPVETPDLMKNKRR